MIISKHIYKDKVNSPVRNFQHPQKPQIRFYKEMDVLLRHQSKVQQCLDPGCINSIQIIIMMPKPSQKALASFQAPDQDLKEIGCSLHLQRWRANIQMVYQNQ